MNVGTPRLRIFAGPNGSGKTTVKTDLQKPAEWFGIDINPDELEAGIRRSGSVELAAFELQTTSREIRDHFRTSPLLQKHNLLGDIDSIMVRSETIDFSGVQFNAYHASALADFIRRKSFLARKTFTFETVMSAPDKVELLRAARASGYRTYLYYIATEDPAINIQRVRNRVADGGHDVPEDKISARYYRSLKLLAGAVAHSSRAFFFDTSGSDPWYFAEAEEGTSIELKSDKLPLWFGPIWDQFDQNTQAG